MASLRRPARDSQSRHRASGSCGQAAACCWCCPSSQWWRHQRAGLLAAPGTLDCTGAPCSACSSGWECLAAATVAYTEPRRWRMATACWKGASTLGCRLEGTQRWRTSRRATGGAQGFHSDQTRALARGGDAWCPPSPQASRAARDAGGSAGDPGWACFGWACPWPASTASGPGRARSRESVTARARGALLAPPP